MTKLPLVYNRFEGGMSTDLKVGIVNSFANSQSIDFRKSPSQLTVLPQLQREDDGVVEDLIQNEVMTNQGTIYAIGDQGKFYRRSATTGLWSLEANLQTGTYGIDYRRDTNSIYVCSPTTVSLYQYVDTDPNLSFVSPTPVMNPDYYNQSFSTYDNTDSAGFNVSSYQVNGTQSINLIFGPGITGNTNAELQKRYFQTDIEPLSQISVYCLTAPTGRLTLTLHDGLDNILAQSFLDTTDIAANTWINFKFDGTSTRTSPVRLYVAPNARTYHYHISSANGDGSIRGTTINDFTSCDTMIYANRLIQTINGMHPMTRYLQYECIGNGNYLSVWEPLEDPPSNADWQRHRLVFPMEYEVCGLATQNEFLVIAAERISSTGNGTPQAGILFFWDGTSPTYNYDIRIPEGSPYALHEYKNVIYYYAGGAWYSVTGPASQPIKIRTMPGTDTEFSGDPNSVPIVVYPYAATVRRGIHLMGWPSYSTDLDINFGVYSWGAIDKNYPESFGYSYPISTGTHNFTTTNNLEIGMVKAFGDLLHVSWHDDENGVHGIDVVDNSSPPATNSFWESRIFDNGFVAREKTGLYIQVTCLTLPNDASFVIKYSVNRGPWIYSSDLLGYAFDSTTIEQGIARVDINDGRFYEIQYGIDIVSGATTPTFTSVTLVFDDNRAEDLL